MKKILALLLAITMMGLFSGCANKTEVTDDNVTLQSAEKNDVLENEDVPEKNVESTGIVNDDGEVFTADLTTKGEIIENAEPISSNNIIIQGVTYTFPIEMSKLINNGWRLRDGFEYDNEFEPNSETNTISYYMVHDSGAEISIDRVKNESDEVKGLEDCKVTRLGIYSYDVVDTKFLVVPGGICIGSKAADVVSVFGDPNKTTDFVGYSYSLDDQLTYVEHKTSKMVYIFTFNEDGSMYSMDVAYEKF